MVCYMQHSKRPSVDELLSHPLLLARFFPSRPDNTLTRPLQPASTNHSDRAAARDAELQARELNVNRREMELDKRAAELDKQATDLDGLVAYYVDLVPLPMTYGLVV